MVINTFYTANTSLIALLFVLNAKYNYMYLCNTYVFLFLLQQKTVVDFCAINFFKHHYFLVLYLGFFIVKTMLPTPFLQINVRFL